MAIEPFIRSETVSGDQVIVYKGVTNASGEFTVLFAEPYLVTPSAYPVQLPTSFSNRTVRITALSTTGFTVKVEQRSSVNLLGIDVLLSATTNVNSANVAVLVIK